MISRLIAFFLIPFFSLYADRFEMVRPILDLYDRPITILAIGESELLYQIIDTYPVVSVLVEPRTIENVPGNQLIQLQKELTLKDLKDLNKREHFDLILAMQSLYHLDNWKESLYEIFKLGDHFIVEILSQTSPKADKNRAIFGISHFLNNLGLTVSLQENDESSLLWYCFKPKSTHPLLYSAPAKRGISLLTYDKHRGRLLSKEWIRYQKKQLPIWKRLIRQKIWTDGKSLY